MSNNFQIVDTLQRNITLTNIVQYTDFNSKLDSLTNVYVEYPLYARITPSSSTSKVMITITGQLQNTAGDTAYLTIYRNGSVIPELASSVTQLGSSISIISPISVSYIDSPSSIQTQTYTIAIKSGNLNIVSWGPNTVIILQEIF